MPWDVPKWWETDPMDKFMKGFQVGQAISQAGLHQQALENSIKEQQLRIAGEGLQNRARALELEHAITEFPNQEKILDLKTQEMDVQSKQKKAQWEQQQTIMGMRDDFSGSFTGMEPGSEDYKRNLDMFFVRHPAAGLMPEYVNAVKAHTTAKQSAAVMSNRLQVADLNDKRAETVARIRADASSKNVETSAESREEVARIRADVERYKRDTMHNLTPNSALAAENSIAKLQGKLKSKDITADDKAMIQYEIDRRQAALDKYRGVNAASPDSPAVKPSFRWDGKNVVPTQ